MPKGMKLKSTTYDKKKGRVKVSVSGKTVKITVKALKPGRFIVKNVVVRTAKRQTGTLNLRSSTASAARPK